MYEGKAWADATIVNLTRSYDRRVKPDAVTLVEEQDGQLSFLEAAEQMRKAAWEKNPVSYADAQGGTKA